MHFVIYHGINGILCIAIAILAFGLNRDANISRLGKMAQYGVKIIMISAMMAVGLTIVSYNAPEYLDVADFISGTGINLGLMLTLWGHSALFKRKAG